MVENITDWIVTAANIFIIVDYFFKFFKLILKAVRSKPKSSKKRRKRKRK